LKKRLILAEKKKRKKVLIPKKPAALKPARKRPAQKALGGKGPRQAVKKSPPHKAAISLDSEPKRQIRENYELPSGYDHTRLVLMVRDPLWVYAYWEVTAADLESAKNKLPPDQRDSAKLVLRMYDVTFRDFDGSNANFFFDIEVGFNSDNWHINLWSDNVAYVGELGLLSWQGQFECLARSNFIQTPRKSFSPRSEQIWMTVDQKGRPAESFVRFKELPKIQKPAPASSSRRMMRMKVSPEDIRRYYMNLSPLLRDKLSLAVEKLMAESEGKYTYFLEGQAGFDRNTALLIFPEAYFVENIPLGASENFLFIGASQPLPEAQLGRKFFFELDAEVIIYGRTEPDAEVYLAGRKIDLRSDGTFSLRCHLPDAKLPFEFKAVSQDKQETRKINTYIQRNTHKPD